jgi:hypothetical protein
LVAKVGIFSDTTKFLGLKKPFPQKGVAGFEKNDVGFEKNDAGFEKNDAGFEKKVARF